MNRKMRRFKQQLSEEKSIEILSSATSGILSLCGEDKCPYGVPLSHVFDNGKLYFHSAISGHKLDIIRQNNNVCFTVIAKDDIHPERYTTYFLSVMAFGKIRIVENDVEKKRILEILGRRCNAEDEERLAAELNRGFSRCLALEMTIENLVGKQAIELVESKD